MLKACCDCIFGYSQEQQANNEEVVYNTHLNGDSRSAPPWPEPREDREIMFVLPRKLGSGDTISITGTLSSNRKRLTISLITGNTSPDYSNIACQFEAVFPNEFSDENKILAKNIQNGMENILHEDQDNTATDIFPGTNFTFEFLIRIRRHDPPILNMSVDDSSILQTLQLSHYSSDIKFLSVSGDIEKVDKLDFKFGNE